MAIAVRSVKAGMTSFGHLRSRLKNGAKPGCKAAAIEPPCSDAYASGFIEPQMLTGVRNLSPINHKTSRPHLKQPLQIRGIRLHHLFARVFNLSNHLYQLAGVVRVGRIARFLQSMCGLFWRIGTGDVGIAWVIG